MRFGLFLFLIAGSNAVGDFNPDWNKPMTPFRLADNLYYVGTNYLASYLITTPAGHILINPDYAESVPVLEQNVEKLGFHFRDVKIILISHAHDDHAAGCALAKKRAGGAKLMVMDADVPLIEHGGVGDFQYTSHWAPAKVDRILHDLSKVELGGITLTAHLTAGHTKGCTTWTLDVKDHGKTLHAVIVGSPNVNSGYVLVGNKKYPQIAADYEKEFHVLRALPCDLFLGAHGAYFNMDEKLKRRRPGEANPFIDPAGYRAYVDDREQAFRKELAAQRLKQQTAKH
jgi:metallo-beta-lactamase class B